MVEQARQAGQATRARIASAVVNGTGYGGVELLRLLRRHPVFEIVEVTARSEIGKRVSDVFPQIPGLDLPFTPTVERAEVVFVALPEHAAVEIVPDLLAAGRRVVDLSAGFRLRDPAQYPTWYGFEHSAPALLEEAVYGLTEWVRPSLTQATRLVACPGCYPTAALLALAPALAHDLLARDDAGAVDVIVDAKSGISGAGRSLKLGSHFSEANEDVSAYGLAGHRHQPEIAQGMQLAQRQGESRRHQSVSGARLTFIPHLVPMTRGILATCYASLRQGVSAEDVRAAYAASYADEPFVRVVESLPHTKWTLGSNLCFVYPTVHPQSGRLIVVSALDNLGKGAAGQAIQCANRLYGLAETTGLPLEGVYP